MSLAFLIACLIVILATFLAGLYLALGLAVNPRVPVWVVILCVVAVDGLAIAATVVTVNAYGG